ncbi:MAG TPA: type II toxin-antitoxin system RatA family toxin [Usitatibacter sp.]|jgi:ribosome-associated toxin RatA of RatAB toxin-antitoxin module
MTTVLKSVLVPHSAATMFALVDDVERYPEFLPWCPSTQLIERTEEVTRARIDIGYHGVKSHISTVNRKQAPEQMDLALVDGPFENFRGQWRFVPLGDAGCRVELSIDYSLSGSAINVVLRPVLANVLETLVDRFVARAQALA